MVFVQPAMELPCARRRDAVALTQAMYRVPANGPRWRCPGAPD